MSGMLPLRDSDPREVAGYRLLGRLGEGGQGVVFLALSPTGTRAAVKLLAPTTDPRVRSRFLKEVSAAQQVAGFCTAQVLDAGIFERRPFIVSEYVSGPSLVEVIQQHGPRSGAVLERIAVATLTALGAVHAVGMVHRDFKPGNVLLGPDGPVVIDFGLAAVPGMTTTGLSGHVAVGTPAFMAPEQLAGARVTAAADMWSWAATIAFAGTGELPFKGESLTATAYAILHSEPTLGPLPEPLGSIILRCLSKNPVFRPSARGALSQMAAAGARLQGPLPPAAPDLTQEEEESGPPPAPAEVPEPRQGSNGSGSNGSGSNGSGSNGIVNGALPAHEPQTVVEREQPAPDSRPAPEPQQPAAGRRPAADRRRPTLGPRPAHERRQPAPERRQPAPDRQPPPGQHQPAAGPRPAPGQQQPAADRRSAADRQPAQRGSGRVRWRWRAAAVVASVLLVVGVCGTALVLAQSGTRPPRPAGSHGGTSGALRSEAAIRAKAVSWILQQVSRSAVVSCDIQVCASLANKGFPLSNLWTLGPQSNDPLNSNLVVATAAVRAQFGNRLTSVYAPAVIASFGSGNARIEILLNYPGGAKGYRAAEPTAARDRKIADAQLLKNSQITFSPKARNQLRRANIDPRLPQLIAMMVQRHPVRIVDFGDQSPGGGPASLLRSVDLATPDRAAHLTSRAFARWIHRIISAQRAQYLPTSRQVRLPTGQAVVRIQYGAPSPLACTGVASTC
jgi:serine/threonine protein kinase